MTLWRELVLNELKRVMMNIVIKTILNLVRESYPADLSKYI